VFRLVYPWLIFHVYLPNQTERRRDLHEYIHNLHASLNIVTVVTSRIRGAEHVECTAAMRTAFKALIRKPEEEKPGGRRRWRREGNCKES
jgi:hypothetical protein